ncbi:hypothetical protein [Woeseia oceani]|uniref:Uncharacterized protein n=1 Tax=Woeseia oceani TaxID=1548547 RepID=A0A193LHL6_9GAMM|nr:hypothetical protein [Woeseia oceani]ANO51884.1 hypothetical protein BA177_12335 [Woeseia oceani]
MDLWAVLEERIKQHGVRVGERLEMLARLKGDHETGGTAIVEDKDSLVCRVDEAAACLKDVLRA